MCKRKSLFVIGMLFLSMVFTGCERAAVSDSNGMELYGSSQRGGQNRKGKQRKKMQEAGRIITIIKEFM